MDKENIDNIDIREFIFENCTDCYYDEKIDIPRCEIQLKILEKGDVKQLICRQKKRAR